MRVTTKDLEAVVARINRLTNSPDKPYTRADGKLTANIGNYHLSGAYGGHALHRMENTGGGVSDIFGGHLPKRELYERMHAFIKGLEAKNQGETKW